MQPHCDAREANRQIIRPVSYTAFLEWSSAEKIHHNHPILRHLQKKRTFRNSGKFSFTHTQNIKSLIEILESLIFSVYYR